MRKWLKLIPYIGVSLLPLIFLGIKTLVAVVTNEILFSDFLLNQRALVLLIKTFFYGVEVTVILLGVGFLAAVGIWLMPQKLRKRIILILIIFIPLPFCIHTLVWMEAVLGLNKVFNDIFQLTGWGISVFVQIMALLPIATIILYERLLAMPRDMMESAQVMGSDFRVFVKIGIPQCKPAFVVAGIVLFIMSFNEYGIASVFALTTYSMEIFAEYSASLSVEKALITALPMILPGVLLIVPLANAIRNGLFQDNTNKKVLVLKKLPTSFKVLTTIIGCIAVIGIIVPVIILIQQSNFLQNNFSFTNDGGVDILTTFIICLVAACLAMPIMYLAGKSIYEERKSLGVWFIVLMPAVIPSSLIGAALINFWNLPGLRFIYASGLMPVMAVMIRFMPFGVLIIANGFKRINQDIIHVANVLVPKKNIVTFQIVLPLLMSSLILASGAVFLLGLGELGSTVMVLPPGLSTVTVRIYGYLHYGASEMVSKISVIILVLIVSLGLALSVLIEKRKGI